VSNATVLDPTIEERELPPSLYLKARPAFFGSIPWPPIGPDVEGMINDFPAKVRFDATH
jgi:hypothetical protein